MRASIIFCCALLSLYQAEAIFFTGTTALTLTVPALTSGTAAALLGGLGALKLGALTGALLASGSRGSGNRRGGRRRSYRRRHGRSAADDDEIPQPRVIAPDLVDLEPMFRQLEAMDSAADCGKRLACEVGAKDWTTRTTGTTLDEKERALMIVLLQSGEINLESAAAPFQLAARLGTIGKDPALCARRYARCADASGDPDNNKV